MRLVIAICLMLFGFTTQAQFQNGLLINPGQSKNKQWIGISSNGKKPLSNVTQPYGTYETKGHFKSILLTDLADAIGNYITPTIEDIVTGIVADSMATISSENMANANLLYDANRKYNVDNHTITYDSVGYWSMMMDDGSNTTTQGVEISPSSFGFSINEPINDYYTQLYAESQSGVEISGIRSGENAGSIKVSDLETNVKNQNQNDGKFTALIFDANADNYSLSSTEKLVVGTSPGGTHEIQSGIVTQKDSLRFYSQSGEYYFQGQFDNAAIPIPADGSEDSQLVFDDITGQWFAKPISGSGPTNYYELVLHCTYIPSPSDTFRIDTVYINTFPDAVWEFAQDGSPHAGFELNATGYTGMDMNESGFPLTYLPMATVFTGAPGDKPIFLLPYVNNASGIAFAPVYADGTNVVAGDFDNITFQYSFRIYHND